MSGEGDEGGPKISTSNWFALALSSMIIGGTLALIAAIWAFSAIEPALMVQRAQVIAPFGVAIGAIITFFTIAWRGVIAQRQLDYQRKQIDQLIRQNDLKVDENSAKLLQEGAKLIAEHEKPAQVLAGVTTLSSMLYNSKQRYGVQIMDLLGSFLVSQYDNSKLDVAVNMARLALTAGADLGLCSNIHARFKVADKNWTLWPVVRGFQSQTYEGGALLVDAFDQIKDEQIILSKMMLANIAIPENVFVQECQLIQCSIAKIEAEQLYKCQFSSCNFTSTKIEMEQYFDLVKPLSERQSLDLKSSGNWFLEGNPPIGARSFDWESILLRIAPPKLDNSEENALLTNDRGIRAPAGIAIEAL